MNSPPTPSLGKGGGVRGRVVTTTERGPASLVSLSRRTELAEVAKGLCREMRRNPTEAEEIFWQAVRRKQLMGVKFYRQYPILHEITGRETFFIADFYCHRARLVVEIDGRIHEFGVPRDTERTELLNLLGLHVLRFRNDEVLEDLERVLEKVQRVVAERSEEQI
jgi:very-short-patch-repair endonuclease